MPRVSNEEAQNHLGCDPEDDRYSLAADLLESRAEVARLRKALEVYANRANWTGQARFGWKAKAIIDEGEIARAALEGPCRE